MLGAAKQGIYGNAKPINYTASTGANILVLGNQTINWQTDMKNTVRWTQFGDFNSTPPYIKSVQPHPTYLEYGNNTFVVLTANQVGAGFLIGNQFGKYIKSGFGYRSIIVNGNAGGPFEGIVSMGLCFGNGVFVSGITSGAGTNPHFIRVARSTDGVNWTLINIADLGIGTTETRVRFGNGAFYMSYQNGQSASNNIYKSTNGTTWTPIPTPSADGAGWAVSPLNSTLFLKNNVLDNGFANFISTDDGVNWIPVTGSGGAGLPSLPYLFNNSVYIGRKINSSNQYMTSTDGYNWTTRTSNLVGNGNDGQNNIIATINDSKFKTARGRFIYESTDAVTWTQVDEFIVLRSDQINGLRYGNL